MVAGNDNPKSAALATLGHPLDHSDRASMLQRVRTFLLATTVAAMVAAVNGGCHQPTEPQRDHHATTIPDHPPEHEAPPRQPIN